MSDDLKLILETAEESMKNASVYLQKELNKYRTGKSNPQMLDTVRVDYYGTPTKLDQVANINTPDPHQIVVQPWEKNMLEPISKAIMEANLGFNPQNNGEILRIIVPALTEERRKDIVKRAKTDLENAKVTLRAIRRNAIEDSKKLEKEGVSEDLIKVFEKDIQTLIDKFTNDVDKIFEDKEKELMSI